MITLLEWELDSYLNNSLRGKSFLLFYRSPKYALENNKNNSYGDDNSKYYIEIYVTMYCTHVLLLLWQKLIRWKDHNNNTNGNKAEIIFTRIATKHVYIYALLNYIYII